MGYIDAKTNFSGDSLAIVLGVISPKTNTKKVTTIVEIVMPIPPKWSTKNTVATEDNRIFTTLLPNNTVDINLSYFSAVSRAKTALRFPSDAKCFNFILFTEEKAVSAAEKNPEHKSKKTNNPIL
jgi:hypothetical protein